MTAIIKWLGHSAFKIVTPTGKVIFIDPWLDNPVLTTEEDVNVADLVLVTHDHFDHVGNAVEIVKKSNAILVAQPETVDRLKNECMLSEENIIFGGFGMNIGGSAVVKGVTVTMVQACHSSVTGAPTGYILTLEDGKRIYHAGDTGVFDSMSLLGSLYPLDLALLPIGGVFTMDPIQAVRALTLLKPRRAIPMHYRTFPILEQTAARFSELAKTEAPDVEVIILEPGDEYFFH